VREKALLFAHQNLISKKGKVHLLSSERERKKKKKKKRKKKNEKGRVLLCLFTERGKGKERSVAGLQKPPSSKGRLTRPVFSGRGEERSRVGFQAAGPTTTAVPGQEAGSSAGRGGGEKKGSFARHLRVQGPSRWEKKG